MSLANLLPILEKAAAYVANPRFGTNLAEVAEVVGNLHKIVAELHAVATGADGSQTQAELTATVQALAGEFAALKEALGGHPAPVPLPPEPPGSTGATGAAEA